MRQVFSSARLENVEKVAQMLQEDGIEVRITNGRSYKGKVRRNFSYRDGGNEGPQPAVWIVKSEDQPRARQILREAGLIDSTRNPGDSYLAPTFIELEPAKAMRAPQSKVFKLKVGILLAIVAILGLIMFQTLHKPSAPASAGGPIGPAATPVALAQAVFAAEIQPGDAKVACLTIDGRDAPEALMPALTRPNLAVAPGSSCVRVAAEGSGSYSRSNRSPAVLVDIDGFRRTSADTAEIRYSAYRHRMRATYKTLEVRQVGGQWRIVRTLKHVSA